MLQEGARDAAARQQANQIQQERIREANAQKLRGIESANQGILNSLSGFAKNLYNNYQQFRSERYNDRLLDLYAKDIDSRSKEDVPAQKQSEERYDFSNNPFAKKLYESMMPKMTFKMDPRIKRELDLLNLGISPFSSLGRSMLLKPNFKFNFSKKIKM